MSVYAMSDLHGCLDLWHQVQNFLKSDDTIFVLGDCGDRGPQSWETIKAVLNEPRAIYLKGNHEDMLCKSLTGYLKHGAPDYKAFQLLCMNGGEETFNDAVQDPNIEVIYNQVLNLPTYMQYIAKNGEIIHLSHAGFTPPGWFESKTFTTHDLVWDREHFFDDWPEEDESFIVHGHTPTLHLIQDLKTYRQSFEGDTIGACYYCGGRKICIDNASFHTGYICLFDLDTFDEHIFQTTKL